ncbi:hypothetical protein CHARACLAT_025405 [Characodon lateralis]|uniref:Uncharacterized protein n=1 Tax=Characodon lateralis TaxID=208331 RepID=A0ABU7EY65_9TELE|nr:hypothetical protein [Characodon lateralis]
MEHRRTDRLIFGSPLSSPLKKEQALCFCRQSPNPTITTEQDRVVLYLAGSIFQSTLINSNVLVKKKKPPHSVMVPPPCSGQTANISDFNLKPKMEKAVSLSLHFTVIFLCVAGSSKIPIKQTEVRVVIWQNSETNQET